MPYKTILAHNNTSTAVTQWQAQYVDTTAKRIALTEGYLYDLCIRAYSAANADPYTLKCIQARQTALLETIALLENVTVPAYAAVNISNMTATEFETFRANLMQCNGFPEYIKAVLPQYRTLNATVEEFLFAVAATQELYELLEKTGILLHRAASASQDPDFEIAGLRIEQYTDFARGNYNYYIPIIQSIIDAPSFDPSTYAAVLTGHLWNDICTDLNAAQISTTANVEGMYLQTPVSSDTLLDEYYELSVLAEFDDALKQITLSEVNSAFTPPVDSLAYPAYKILLASGSFTGDLTADFAANALGSGMFISVVQDTPAKEREFCDRLDALRSTYTFLNKGIDRVHFNTYLTDACPNAAAYLNIQPEPPGIYDDLEGTLDGILTDTMTIANTTGDMVINNDMVLFEDYDIFGDLYLQNSLTVYQCNPTVEGSVYQTAGTLEPMDSSLTIAGSYQITGHSFLHLLRPGDAVKVGDKFLMASSEPHDNLLTDGVLSVGGNFVQEGNSTNFNTSGNHKTVLFGSNAQHVSFSDTASGFTQLELQNDDIYFDTELRSLTLSCDLTVRNKWNWRGGTLNLNGFTINEYDDFTVSGGEILLSDGHLNVDGNLTVNGTGSLPMTNPNDRVTVGGDFMTNTMTNHAVRLIHGVMTVKGNFSQAGDPQSFAASNDHQVILNGFSPIQHVTFADVTSGFNRLTLMNDYPADYSFTPSVCWNQLEIITTVNSVYLQPRLQNLVPDSYTNLYPGVRGKNLSAPAYTLTLSGNTSQSTRISNDILYIGADEQSAAVTVTIISADDPNITESYLFRIVNPQNLPNGDLNFDGGLTISDATMLQENLAEMYEFLSAQTSLSDFNNDGYVNIRDVTAIQRRLAELE